jgi:hypothetical protein
LNLAVALYASGRRSQAKAEAGRAQAAGARPHPDFLRALAEKP